MLKGLAIVVLFSFLKQVIPESICGCRSFHVFKTLSIGLNANEWIWQHGSIVPVILVSLHIGQSCLIWIGHFKPLLNFCLSPGLIHLVGCVLVFSQSICLYCFFSILLSILRSKVQLLVNLVVQMLQSKHVLLLGHEQIGCLLYVMNSIHGFFHAHSIVMPLPFFLAPFEIDGLVIRVVAVVHICALISYKIL